MANRLILNQVAIWRPKLNDGFSVRKSPSGRIYFENNIAKTTQRPTYRYAKNYTVGKGKSAVKFCLMIMSEINSEKVFEKFLDDTSKKIDLSLAQRVLITSTESNFEYTDFKYKENK